MHLPLIVLFLNLGGGEIMLILLIVVMFFGTDKLPQVVRTLGKGIKDMKNATAEIQREIEKGSTEIQRDLNLGAEINELKDATDKIKKRISEGLNDIEDHHNDSKVVSSTLKEINEQEKDNPLVPPDAVKRD